MPNPRKSARGLTYIGRACRHSGHGALRSTATGRCVECDRLAALERRSRPATPRNTKKVALTPAAAPRGILEIAAEREARQIRQGRRKAGAEPVAQGPESLLHQALWVVL